MKSPASKREFTQPRARLITQLCVNPGIQLGIEVQRILKIRTPYPRILSPFFKGLSDLGIEYFEIPGYLVKSNDLIGNEYLEVSMSLLVPNDLVGI